MRPRIEMIRRYKLELDVTGSRRRERALLVAGLEQQPVGERALADGTERPVRPLVAGQDLDLLRIVVIAADDQDGELVKARRLLVLEGIDGVGIAPGPDLDPLVLLAAGHLAPA